MIRFGFDAIWVDLMMACVSSVRYQVGLNNDLSRYIYPSRAVAKEITFRLKHICSCSVRRVSLICLTLRRMRESDGSKGL
jgi:hypothetical protein